MAATTTHTASWGVSGTVGSVSGIATDIDINGQALIGLEQNEVGAVVGAAHYDDHTTVSATVLVAASTAKPTLGSQATIAGVTGFVTGAEVVENNMSYRKIRVTIEAYENCDEVFEA